jgi:type VII secretion-associated serine protease mycosin
VKLTRLTVAAALCAAATLALQPVPASADATRDRQWHLGFLDVAEAHRHTQGDGVTVAVIDTGVNANHPDLRGNVLPGRDTTNGRSTGTGTRDDHGHGTAMAGLIAAHGHGTGDGALGLAPRAKVMPIRETDAYGFGSDPGMVAGIDWAIANGAKVISISRAGSTTPTLRAAVARAREADVVVVAGVGNTDGETFVAGVARIEGVLAAAGTDRTGNHAAISVAGPQVVLAAPAVDITSTSRDGGYRTGTGTSDSTAIIAGAVALVRAKFPELSADEVIHRLTATATDKGPPGRDEQYGYGVLNLVAALTANVAPANQASALPSATPAASPPTTAAAAPEPGPNASSNSGTTLLVVLVVLVALVTAGVIAWLVARMRRGSG